MAELSAVPAPEAPNPPAPSPPPPALPDAPAPADPWSPARRVAFRFGFSLAALLCVPALFANIPWAGKLEEFYEKGVDGAARWLAALLFHPAAAEMPEQSGSGDGIHYWVQMGAFLALSLAAAATWSALDRRRSQYRTLAGWLHLGLRWALFFWVIVYGVDKIFAMQMPWDDARLLEPLGEMSPMGFLWTFMGFSPGYQMLSGWGEAMGAALLLHRRTSTVGALLLLGVLGNVVAVNFFYDVPVKIFSTQLWLTALAVASPDLPRLFRLLVLRRPVEPAPDRPLLPARLRTGRWRHTRWALPVVAAAWASWTVVDNARHILEFKDEVKPGVPSTAIAGTYQVESFTVPASAAPGSPLAGPAWARVAGGSLARVFILRVDGSFARFRVEQKPDGTITLTSRAEPPATATVRFEQSDPEHLRLFAEGFEVKLKRLPPDTWLLTSRGFHWAQPLPVNR